LAFCLVLFIRRYPHSGSSSCKAWSAHAKQVSLRTLLQCISRGPVSDCNGRSDTCNMRLMMNGECVAIHKAQPAGAMSGISLPPLSSKRGGTIFGADITSGGGGFDACLPSMQSSFCMTRREAETRPGRASNVNPGGDNEDWRRQCDVLPTAQRGTIAYSVGQR